jgi:hypothetical protein
MIGAGDLGTRSKEIFAGDLVLGGREMGTGPANGYEPAPFLRPGPPKLRPKTVKRFGVKRLLGEKEQLKFQKGNYVYAIGWAIFRTQEPG